MSVQPVMEDEGVTYLYIKHNNLYLLAVTDVNASPAMILLYLYQVIEVSPSSFIPHTHRKKRKAKEIIIFVLLFFAIFAI